MAVGRAALDHLRCSHPEHGDDDPCGALWFHSRCHPSKPTWARYEDGVLRIECAKCKGLIVEVAVRDDRGIPAFLSLVDGPPDMGGAGA